MYKDDRDKRVDVLFRTLTTLVPESWTPKLYAIFLCDLVLRQSMWMCIYLDIKHDNSIESINGINVLYPVNISKLKYNANSSLALSFIKGGPNKCLILINMIIKLLEICLNCLLDVIF